MRWNDHPRMSAGSWRRQSHPKPLETHHVLGLADDMQEKHMARVSASGDLGNVKKTSFNVCKILAHFRRGLERGVWGAHFSRAAGFQWGPGCAHLSPEHSI